MRGGRRDAFGLAPAWSPSRVPPSRASSAPPAVGSPQHRPAASPSWQESHGRGAKNKRAVPLVFKHTSAGARGRRKWPALHSWASFLFGGTPEKNLLLSRGRRRRQLGHEAAQLIHVRACNRAGCGAVAAGQSIRGEASGHGRNTSPPLHPWGSFPSPAAARETQKGARRGRQAVFFLQCTLDQSEGGKATGGRAEFWKQQLPPAQAAWPQTPLSEGDSSPPTPKTPAVGTGK